MLISCNRLKNYIKDAQDINWIEVWDEFSLKTAEVEKVEVKGKDIDNVVVSQILDCQKVENSNKLHKLVVDNGHEHIQIICGAPNVKSGMKAPLVNIGGHIGGFKITKRKLAGLESNGMMCSKEELGFELKSEGILELPDEYEVGKDIKQYLDIEDIIVQIDNKSLTNRPDLWGHYGIAREIAAITSHKLLPLDLFEIENNKDDLDIKIKSEKCLRYCGLKVANISKNQTPFNMQIFLYYCGMRSISLIVDLTNYLMLELGQPMHAFDARAIKSIEIDMAKKDDKFITLDNEEHTLSDEVLMIKKNNKYYAIAGIMGGLDSEIKSDTTSIILESATFDAATIRKAATYLGMRSESSARYEKSLDPNMTIIAIKRLIYLLHQIDPKIKIISNLTDIYPHVLKPLEIDLKKASLAKYMGISLEDNYVKKLLESLEFKVKCKKDSYAISIPTFRATKDISIQADVIEEIARLYGYENITLEPLKTVQSFKLLENIQEIEYDIKKLLATMFNFHEVHTYLWYKTAFLNKLNITKENTKLLAKCEDNILRDDLGLSLIEVASNNLKNYDNIAIFEIGTIILNNQNKRCLAISLADDYNLEKELFYKGKKVIMSLFKIYYNIDVDLINNRTYEYYDENLSYDIIYKNEILGNLNVLKSSISSLIHKKKCFVVITIDFDKFVNLKKQNFIFEPVSKYPVVNLDYTILMSKDKKYQLLEDIINKFQHTNIKNVKYINCYEDKNQNKYTIRFSLASNTKTLTSEELQNFKTKFINHIKKNGLDITQ